MTRRADLASKLRLLALLFLPGIALDACIHTQSPSWTLASSPAVLEGRPADVTRALSEDPPLPGAAPGTRAWFGLAEPVADPHAHHHGGGHAH